MNAPLLDKIAELKIIRNLKLGFLTLSKKLCFTTECREEYLEPNEHENGGKQSRLTVILSETVK